MPGYHEAQLDSIIDKLTQNPKEATLQAMDYAEMEHATRLYRLHAICLAMEGFLRLKEPEQVLALQEVATEMQSTMTDKTASLTAIMKRVSELTDLAGVSYMTEEPCLICSNCSFSFVLIALSMLSGRGNLSLTSISVALPRSRPTTPVISGHANENYGASLTHLSSDDQRDTLSME